MYEPPKIFKLKKISKSLYLITTENGFEMTTPYVHGTDADAMAWARAWASTWPNTKVIYED